MSRSGRAASVKPLARAILLAAMLFPAVVLGGPQRMGPVEAPEALLRDLRNKIDRWQAEKAKAADDRTMGDGAAWSEVADTLSRFFHCDDRAVPILQRALAREKNPGARGVIMRALGRVPGDEANRALVDIFCSKSKANARLRGSAMEDIVWRCERDGPLTFLLTDEQLAIAVEDLGKGDVFLAGRIARFLAMCAANPPEPRIAPIVDAFHEEIANPTVGDTEVVGAYVSGKVYALNQFLLAFQWMGEQSWPSLQAARTCAQTNGEEVYAKWLTLGLALAGDPGVAAGAKDILLHDTDRYVRCVAVRAYAASAGTDAIPTLEALLDDKTVSEYQGSSERPVYLIAFEAHSQLNTFRREKTQTEPQENSRQ